MAQMDPHSYADDTQARTKHLDWKILVDFEKKIIKGDVSLAFHSPASGFLDLDTRGLNIRSAHTASGAKVPFELDEEDAILGRRLRLQLPAGTTAVRIEYETSPNAIGLQWLSPEQ